MGGEGPSRRGLHFLILKRNTSVFLLWWCVTSASLFTLCLERSILPTTWDISPLFNLWWALHLCITWRAGRGQQRQSRSGHAERHTLIQGHSKSFKTTPLQLVSMTAVHQYIFKDIYECMKITYVTPVTTDERKQVKSRPGAVTPCGLFHFSHLLHAQKFYVTHSKGGQIPKKHNMTSLRQISILHLNCRTFNDEFCVIQNKKKYLSGNPRAYFRPLIICTIFA